MPDEDWVSLGGVDHGKDVAEGTIALSERTAKAAGGHKVLVVRCHEDGVDKAGPKLQLKVAIEGKLAPTVSDADYKALKATEFGPEIEVRKLTSGERRKRVAIRLALPVIVLVIALAALLGVIFDELNEVIGIVVAVLGIPSAVVGVVKALRET